ncbi:hypothetical protein [Vibrio splendidus]|uniref:hypothetical protein n=1 Tax=Vibrio splendidus TaxID=29497 RepID=UPI00080EE7F5|nr:hypothetical protein [Vibrio splendidus]OCH66388.1 hypothetical protein A6D94_23620 [Vibrio splendidus]
MSFEDEIINKWQEIQDLDREQQAFQKLCNTRDAYREQLKKTATGDATIESTEGFKNAERAAFIEYSRLRINLELKKNEH